MHGHARGGKPASPSCTSAYRCCCDARRLVGAEGRLSAPQRPPTDCSAREELEKSLFAAIRDPGAAPSRSPDRPSRHKAWRSDIVVGPSVGAKGLLTRGRLQ